MKQSFSCTCCGHNDFSENTILWKELINQWELLPEEVDYINRQQGVLCNKCGANLRSITLAGAIMNCYGFKGTLEKFVKSDKNKSISLLEVNEAGHLSRYLRQLSNHTLATYPDIDMTKMPYKNASYQLVVHSDTLEHVKDPVIALKETYRILEPGGYTCFTIPIIIGRLSRTRINLTPSYHGSPGNNEYLVHTEYGSDAWTQLLEAGFQECRLFSIEYPSSVAVIGHKSPNLH